MPELLDIWLTFGSDRPRQAMLIFGWERWMCGCCCWHCDTAFACCLQHTDNMMTSQSSLHV